MEEGESQLNISINLFVFWLWMQNITIIFFLLMLCNVRVISFTLPIPLCTNYWCIYNEIFSSTFTRGIFFCFKDINRVMLHFLFPKGKSLTYIINSVVSSLISELSHLLYFNSVLFFSSSKKHYVVLTTMWLVLILHIPYLHGNRMARSGKHGQS